MKVSIILLLLLLLLVTPLLITTLNAKIFGRFNFRTIPYGSIILVSENYGDI